MTDDKMTILRAWAQENRETLISGIMTEWNRIGLLSHGHASDEDLAENAIGTILDSWDSDLKIDGSMARYGAVRPLLADTDEPVDADVVDPWGDTVAAIESFFEAEGIIAEGWVLAVEDASVVRSPKDAVVSFGSKDITPAHAYGILAFAGDNVHKGMLR